MAGLHLDESRVAVVTGGASGIGKAIVRALVARRVRVAVLDVDESAMRELAAESGRIFPYRADVSDWASLAAAATEVLADLGRVDVLCANAGIASKRTPLWRQDPLDVEKVLRVNVLGLTNTIRAFVPPMIERREGHVVVTGSYLSFVTRSGGGNGAYACSKHADLAITEVLAHEFDQAGVPIGVSIVGPGPVTTSLLARASTSDDLAEEFPLPERILEPITPDDAAAATVAAVEDGHKLVVIGDAAAEYVRDQLTARRETITTV